MTLVEILPGDMLPIAHFEQDCDCDDLPGAQGTMTAPLVVYSSDARFDIAPNGPGVVTLSVRGCLAGEENQVWACHSEKGGARKGRPERCRWR